MSTILDAKARLKHISVIENCMSKMSKLNIAGSFEMGERDAMKARKKSNHIIRHGHGQTADGWTYSECTLSLVDSI